ncbi:hypothetical protein TNCV_937381 [Trichonephila clavipes]|nr:hypothetical protein TNCV_937381 [Trichonephila clavipes]
MIPSDGSDPQVMGITGQVEPDGPRRPHGGQRNRTTKILELPAMSLETLPEFNDISMEPFPTHLHEEVHARTFRIAPWNRVDSVFKTMPTLEDPPIEIVSRDLIRV